MVLSTFIWKQAENKKVSWGYGQKLWVDVCILRGDTHWKQLCKVPYVTYNYEVCVFCLSTQSSAHRREIYQTPVPPSLYRNIAPSLQKVSKVSVKMRTPGSIGNTRSNITLGSPWPENFRRISNFKTWKEKLSNFSPENRQEIQTITSISLQVVKFFQSKGTDSLQQKAIWNYISYLSNWERLSYDQRASQGISRHLI